MHKKTHDWIDGTFGSCYRLAGAESTADRGAHEAIADQIEHLVMVAMAKVEGLDEIERDCLQAVVDHMDGHHWQLVESALFRTKEVENGK
jgi:hypothetical protein